MAPEDDPWDDLTSGLSSGDFIFAHGDPKLLYLLGHVLAGKVAYRIEHLLHKGGMGHVFLARCVDDPSARVVVKVLSPEHCKDEYRSTAFAREAAVLGHLQCLGVPRLLASGTLKDGLPYMVLEYMEGTMLEQICAQAIRNEERLPIADVVRLMIKICAVVGEVHADWVVHRDLKPEHILVCGKLSDNTTSVALLDFGLAVFATQVAEVYAGECASRMAWGTPEYMSPEQATRLPMTHQVDIYALGVILYELLTGCLPAIGSELMLLMVKKVHGQLSAPEALRPEIPPALSRLTMAALAVNPNQRPATVAEFQASLLRCLAEVKSDSHGAR